VVLVAALIGRQNELRALPEDEATRGHPCVVGIDNLWKSHHDRRKHVHNVTEGPNSKFTGSGRVRLIFEHKRSRLDIQRSAVDR
jgi:hypothetical protein